MLIAGHLVSEPRGAMPSKAFLASFILPCRRTSCALFFIKSYKSDTETIYWRVTLYFIRIKKLHAGVTFIN